jgi:hypothetical protein
MPRQTAVWIMPVQKIPWRNTKGALANDDNDIEYLLFGSYAGAQNTLEEFKRRFNEIANDKNDIGYVHY